MFIDKFLKVKSYYLQQLIPTVSKVIRPISTENLSVVYLFSILFYVFKIILISYCPLHNINNMANNMP